ncbi:Beta-ketoacyl polyketide synthase domains-containing [Desulfonema limicola]|uniref:Beta-ketoacyl polyketide synthase domains-containing n=1 Tax=Desulfonema limicola TaxID=45656 RepID=A0A975BDF5_9BACT|nr:beta-ketoacyl synthase N-terminal-like domain-containing protein [Desulfonema limicola]QTA83482.1 Beta-ketoacyl polyketide synthase domains-containing [Desulfonema limicola]
MNKKIAIIGISCLLPGALNYKEYWDNLISGRDSKSMAGVEQMGVDPKEYFDPAKGTADKFYCMEGGYIRDFKFDPSGYFLPEHDIEKLDDLFKWSLYTAREALKDSGYLDRHENCGIILGNLSFPTRYSNHLFIPIYHRAVESSLKKLLKDENFKLPCFTNPEHVSDENAMISGYPSALIAQAFNLSGTCFSIDAACSSSIYSIKLACDYLLSGRADMMLAGAVSAADPFFVSMGFSIFQAHPNIPGSSPLDKNSRGLVAGEGAGMFVLKRYEDAVNDGDKIYACILGTGLSNDGRGQSVLSPSADGQNIAFERAYERAGINPKEIAYVECHATGTPLGDKVELDSMDTFFGKYGASPLVGSSKSNLGHLLTAAGMSGMIKTILAMSHKKIPATINLKHAHSSKNNVISASQIPNTLTPWPQKTDLIHAAVSGFGFGGTNGHIVLEYDKNQEKKTDPGSFEKKEKQPCPMAIIGMDALFGNSRGIAEFHQTTYDGLQHFIPLPEKRWKGIDQYKDILQDFGFKNGKPPKGAYIDKFELDFLRFRIPPNKDDRLIPQQLITLKVADNAIREARLEQGSNVAVLVAMGTELALHQFRGRVNLTTQLQEILPCPDKADDRINILKSNIKESIHGVAKVNQYTSFIGNIMASRIASVWDFSGPAFSISSEENSVFKSLETAQLLLENSEVDAVVVAGVDLAGGFENVLLKNRQTGMNTGRPTLSFDKNSNGWMVGEGAGAVVLKSLDAARKQGDIIYAGINAVEFSKGIDSAAVQAACKKAFKTAKVSPSDVNYLEVHASGIPEQDQAEISGLLGAYQDSGQKLKCAIGSAKANIGHTFAASGMAGLIRTALCLYNRFIPKTPGWSGPKQPEQWEKSPFFVPTESRTWFADGTRPRIAAINSMGDDRACVHLILKDEPGQSQRKSDYFTRVSPCLIILAGDNFQDIESGLEGLASELDSDKDLPLTAKDFYKTFLQNTSAPYRLCLTGQSKNEIHEEIEAAKSGIKQALKDNAEWSSERGSYFTPEPLGSEGKIAFVYPGGFNSYIGLGRNLFQLFPDVYEKAGDYTSQLGDLLGSEILYPKSMTSLSEEEIKAMSAQLFNTPAVMFESGIMSAILYTDIIRESFGISPNQALGYSMGEVSMLFALGVWDRTDQISKTLRESPVFQSRITGSMENVRKAWNLQDSEKRRSGTAIN